MKKNFLCVLLLLLCPVIYGQYDDFDEAINTTERIINFHSDIVIDTTGVIRVTESIKLYAGGYDIQRGIIRNIPVYRTDKYGKKHKLNIDIISVLRNGHKEDYKIEKAGRDKKIYIGNPNVYLEPGIYEYIIIYESSGQIGFFDEFDELYWNVTGNEWVFDIEQASASIMLPNDVHSISTSCYTSFDGSTEMLCFAEEAGNIVHFETNELLAPREGFTVAVSFPRDIIKRPPPPSQLELLWEKYKHHITALMCLLIFGIFFYSTWRKVGQDPRKPVVIPTFRPPHDRSPAATRYLYKRKYDDKVFTAALVNMAVKKAIRISNKTKKYTLESLVSSEALESLNLSKEEKKIYDTLFVDNKSVTVTDKNHVKFAKTNLNLTTSLQNSWNLKDYFVNNGKYAAWGMALFPLLTALYVLIAGNLTTEFMIFFTVPFIGLAAIWKPLRKHTKGCLAYLFKILGYIILGMSSAFMSIVAIIVAIMLIGETWVPGIFMLTLLILCILYVYLIKVPTKLGAQTASELKGFKMYLKTAEENRLNFLTPPEKTPELFEKLLPYAIALGVENEWGKKFTDILKQFNYFPDWYTGDEPLSLSKFPSTLSQSFSSSVSRAKINPTSSSSSSGGSWSSGSSGGGRSGGGGGGGGGRGW